MKIVQLIRLLIKNALVIILFPIICAVLVYYITKGEKNVYQSYSIVYTGIMSGYNVESLESHALDFFSINNAFDNLINIIKTRETAQKVSLKLLAQHLSLSEPNKMVISEENRQELLNKIKDAKIEPYIVINDEAKTYNKLLECLNEGKEGSDFLKYLLSSNDQYYSINALRKIVARRVQSSDLIELRFESQDPAICQKTIELYTIVFAQQYRETKENQVLAVVEYFEKQLVIAHNELQRSEDKLLEFNKTNNLINYYEQTKSIAIEHDDLEKQYQEELMKLSGAKAKIDELESKMNNQERVNVGNIDILPIRNELNKCNAELYALQLENSTDSTRIETLKNKSLRLKQDIENKVNALFSRNTSKEGVAIERIINDWLDAVLSYEEVKARLTAFDTRKRSFETLYKTFAPLGAQMKRLERTINVDESKYLEILHGLNMARLKEQNIGLSTNIKTVDAPYFPYDPIPSKRKIIIALAFIATMFIVICFIILVEFFDKNLKNKEIGQREIKHDVVALCPKIGNTFAPKATKEAMDASLKLCVNKIYHQYSKADQSIPFTILLFSTLKEDGKTFIINQLNRILLNDGFSTSVLSYHNIEETESNKQINYIHYAINSNYYTAKSITELSTEKPLHQNQIVFLEIPALCDTTFPARLLQSIDFPIMAARANRAWSSADKNLISQIIENFKNPMQVILNGVDLDEMESILNEVPKRRSKFRRYAKKIIQGKFKLKTRI